MTMGLDALRVLLADDNPHMRAIVMTLLESFGVNQVREVRDGSEGLVVLRDWPADLAIVDYKMAPMDGVGFTRQVRATASSRTAYLPIIMMTGHSARARVLDARDAGVTEFIAKPVNAKTLLNRIYSVIYKSRPFVRTADYFGPDRRRRSDPNYAGPRRRAGEIVRALSLDDDDLVWELKAS